MAMTLEEKIAKMESVARTATRDGAGIADVWVRHDHACPALRTGRIVDCTCDPDIETYEKN